MNLRKIKEGVKTFESLEVWQSAKDLVMFTYSYFGNCRDYSFKDQICRASISVMNNIAEGYERDSVNEFIRFLKIAKGSCGEERSMLTIAVELGFVSSEEGCSGIDKCSSISRQLSGFIKYLSCKRS